MTSEAASDTIFPSWIRTMRLASFQSIFVVRDQDDRIPVPVQLLQEIQELMARLRIERARRLVRQDDRRAAGQRARDGYPLLLAAGELRGEMMHFVRKADALQNGLRGFDALVRRHAGVQKRQLDVFKDVQLRDQIVLLENEADFFIPDPGQFVVGEGRYVRTVQKIPSRGRHVEAADDIHAGRFPRARLPDDRHEFALLNRKADPVDGADLAVAHLIDLINFVQFNHGCYPPNDGLALPPLFPPLEDDLGAV